MTATQLSASTGTGDSGRAAHTAALPTPDRRPRRRGQWAAWAFLAPVVIYLVVFYAYPLVRNLDLSLRDYTVRSFIDGTAPFVWFANYLTVFQDPTFWPALANTATFTLVSIVFQYSIGMALAVFFFQRFPLSATLRALFLVPWLLPLLVSASAWSWMLNSDSGVVNYLLSLLGVDAVNWLTSPQWALVSVLIANIWIGVPCLGHHDPARARLHAEGVRHHLDHDPRRSRVELDHLRHLVVPPRVRVRPPRPQPRGGGRQPAHRDRPGLRADLHPRPAPTGGLIMRRRPWWITAIGIVLTAIMLFPIYWMINVSLTPQSDMRKSPPDLFPLTPTFEGYEKVLSDQLPYLGTSFVIGIGTVVLTLLLSAPAAYSLAKLRPRGGNALSFALLIAQMIPGIIMAMGFYAIYLNAGILNSVPGLILADSTLAVPFGVLIFTAFMRGIPDELLAAARIDGAGTWRTFRSIVLPVSRNSIVTVSLFAFLWSWSDFIFASTLNSGGKLQPITIGIYRYIGNNNQEWNAIMATAVVASIPAAVLLILAQRYVAAGVTAGAVKD
ncbi:MAG: ABC-type sugar transport system, permease component [Microbacterium sp.]|nr:ABC-type sugar transport system, permease component [Microbacterium sp.]